MLSLLLVVSFGNTVELRVNFVQIAAFRVLLEE